MVLEKGKSTIDLTREVNEDIIVSYYKIPSSDPLPRRNYNQISGKEHADIDKLFLLIRGYISQLNHLCDIDKKPQQYFLNDIVFTLY